MSRRVQKTAATYFPSNTADPIELADWLEILALTAADGDASAADMERPLRRLGNGAPEPLIAQVFTEIDRRVKAAGDAYPFVLNNAVITRRGAPDKYIPYVFCLLLSYFKWKAKKGVPYNPWLLFEEMSCVAAGQYMDASTTCMLFGTSARGKNDTFRTAINALCGSLREGNGFREQKTNAKDDKLDVVVWKSFPDAGPSQVIMFGQCAAGDDWHKKVSELQPEAFSTQWPTRPFMSPIIRSFYIPHRVNPDFWEMWARKAGVLFDRCRIAHFAQKQYGYFTAKNRFLDCCKQVSPVPLN